jgi:hypothetical protein
MTTEEAMTLAEAAQRFGYKVRTLQRAARESRLGARKSSGTWIVTTGAMQKWIAHGRHTPGRPRKQQQAAS